ncbi:MAG: YmdB family metallophosphoesterase, partial [Armatimonadota bacterium]
MNLLVVGDVVGRAGRRAMRERLPPLMAEHGVDFVVANCENAAAGFGITPKIVREILELGVDVITMGNHMWAKKDVLGIADTEPRLLRPANYPEEAPGVGAAVFVGSVGISVGVISLCGRTFMAPLDCPFRAADDAIDYLGSAAPVVVVDFHAEATSEKQAMARHLDGRVSVVAGTHTHVQTADETILPGGTAYITDCGMTGAADSIIGMKADSVLRRFLTCVPAKFEPA